MGNGTIGNKSGYKTRRGYYLSHDYDERFGGEFDFLLEPLHGNDGERFFYVERKGIGMYEVTGEGYIVTSKDSLSQHLKTLKRELRGKSIWYYHIDGQSGNVIRKEKGNEIQA